MCCNHDAIGAECKAGDDLQLRGQLPVQHKVLYTLYYTIDGRSVCYNMAQFHQRAASIHDHAQSDNLLFMHEEHVLSHVALHQYN